MANEKVLSKTLNDVYNQTIALDKKCTKDLVQEYLKVVSEVMDQLKQTNKLFQNIYSGIYYTGSYYDGLRVSEATEFDLDIILKLPVNVDKIKIITKNVCPGYVKINLGDEIKWLRQHPRWTEIYREIDYWITPDGYLNEGKLNQWFESILNKSLEKRSQDGFQAKVKLSKSGPAITLKLLSLSPKIDIDLVPVFQFQHPLWPNLPVRQYNNEAKKTWLIVPKKKNDQSRIFWRLAFPYQELEMLSKKRCLKKILKMIKKLRDTQKWNFLSSYYIKTLFLWEVEEKRSSPEFWCQNEGFLFLHMLKKLRDCLQQKRIKFFWHKDCNLLETIPDSKIDHGLKMLNKIIDAIVKDPLSVESYLVSDKDKYVFVSNDSQEECSETSMQGSSTAESSYSNCVIT